MPSSVASSAVSPAASQGVPSCLLIGPVNGCSRPPAMAMAASIACLRTSKGIRSENPPISAMPGARPSQVSVLSQVPSSTACTRAM